MKRRRWADAVASEQHQLSLTVLLSPSTVGDKSGVDASSSSGGGGGDCGTRGGCDGGDDGGGGGDGGDGGDGGGGGGGVSLHVVPPPPCPAEGNTVAKVLSTDAGGSSGSNDGRSGGAADGCTVDQVHNPDEAGRLPCVPDRRWGRPMAGEHRHPHWRSCQAAVAGTEEGAVTTPPAGSGGGGCGGCGGDSEAGVEAEGSPSPVCATEVGRSCVGCTLPAARVSATAAALLTAADMDEGVTTDDGGKTDSDCTEIGAPGDATGATSGMATPVSDGSDGYNGYAGGAPVTVVAPTAAASYDHYQWHGRHGPAVSTTVAAGSIEAAQPPVLLPDGATVAPVVGAAVALRASVAEQVVVEDDGEDDAAASASGGLVGVGRVGVGFSSGGGHSGVGVTGGGGRARDGGLLPPSHSGSRSFLRRFYPNMRVEYVRVAHPEWESEASAPRPPRRRSWFFDEPGEGENWVADEEDVLEESDGARDDDDDGGGDGSRRRARDAVYVVATDSESDYSDISGSGSSVAGVGDGGDTPPAPRWASESDVTAAHVAAGRDIQGIEWASMTLSRETYRVTRMHDQLRGTMHEDAAAAAAAGEGGTGAAAGGGGGGTAAGAAASSDSVAEPGGAASAPPAPGRVLLETDVRRDARFFHFFHNTRAVKCTVVHFQLRNLVAAPTAGDVYLMHDQGVVHWDKAAATPREVLHLPSDARASVVRPAPVLAPSSALPMASGAGGSTRRRGVVGGVRPGQGGDPTTVAAAAAAARAEAEASAADAERRRRARRRRQWAGSSPWAAAATAAGTSGDPYVLDSLYYSSSGGGGYPPPRRRRRQLLALTPEMADTVARSQLSAFTVRGRLLVAAGFGGELVVKDLSRGRLLHYSLLTHDENAITNAVQLVDGPGVATDGDRLLTASNDCVVRLFDTERLGGGGVGGGGGGSGGGSGGGDSGGAAGAPVASYKLDWAVNAVAQQPRGGKLLAAVGDALSAVLLDASSGKTVATLGGHAQFSFAVSWHPDGHLFATGSQDHTCRVWDVRMISSAMPVPVATAAAGGGVGGGGGGDGGGSGGGGCNGGTGSPVLAVLYAHLGPVRSVAFSPCGRFLGLAEPRDFVHIYDVAGGGAGGGGCGGGSHGGGGGGSLPFGRAQEIDLFGEVGGLAWSPDADALYVGVHDVTYGSLMEFHRTDYRRESWALF
ncbi:hypothetical protein MMPV_009213 [Pyropia vietnamensis]